MTAIFLVGQVGPVEVNLANFLIDPVGDILANDLVGTVIPVKANLAAFRRWSSRSR